MCKVFYSLSVSACVVIRRLQQGRLLLVCSVAVFAGLPISTATAQYTETICDSTNAAIPDNDPNGVTAAIDIPVSAPIVDLTVRVQFANHTWAGDLIVTLTHVDTGNSVDLVHRVGRVGGMGFGDGGDYNGFYHFNDAFSGNLWTVAALIDSATFLPQGPYFPTTKNSVSTSLLAAFAGEDVGGLWELNVSDNAVADTGTLTSWCLEWTTDCDDTVVGVLDMFSPHYDRIESNDVDPNCNAPSTDSAQDNMPFAAIPIHSPAGGNLLAEITEDGTNVPDTVMSVYCDPFDPADPMANLIAFDDNTGIGLLSQINSVKGAALAADTRYWIVVSTSLGNDMHVGDFELCLANGFRIIDDSDADGLLDDEDNCIDAANAGQADSDGDGSGDECDLCEGDDASGDSDGDGVCDDTDICPNVADPGQEDADGDGVGDACEAPAAPQDMPADCCGGGFPMLMPFLLLGWRRARRRIRPGSPVGR